MSIVCIVGLSSLHSATSFAFTHVVRDGETLASISKQFYGRTDYERILVSANALDALGGNLITPGTHLHIPNVVYRRVSVGDDWPKLSESVLGSSKYAPILAYANDTQAWLIPDPGSVFKTPYILRYIASNEETIFDVADRFLGDKMLAWQLTLLNDSTRNKVSRGDVLLVPLSRLILTPEGEGKALDEYELNMRLRYNRIAYEKQHKIGEEIPKVWSFVQSGRYIEAIRLGEQLRALGDLTQSQIARLAKSLTIAYVALDATSAAIETCQLYQENARTIHLEPETTSPKVRAVCGR